MRSDYALYMVAIIFFLLTVTAAVMLAVEYERNLWVLTTAVLGLLFLGLGYSQRPKQQVTVTEVITSPAPTPAPPPTVTTATEVVAEPKAEITVETAPPKVELTKIKGIGEKRAEQLKALGINAIEDLANASAKDLAAKLKISPKITGKWIENAKTLAKKS